MAMMVSLVGEQVAPILLPILYLDPDSVLLVVTQRTREIAARLAGMFSECFISDDVPAYDIPGVYEGTAKAMKSAAPDGAEVVFNLTGGTKPMALAVHQLARERGDDWIYLQSEGARSRLYRFHSHGEARRYRIDEIPSLLILDVFLRAHLGTYQQAPPQHWSERLVLEALSGEVDECMTSVTHGGSLEIDLVLRCGNQVGIAEVKTGKGARSKAGIDQLTTAGEQRYLGTYTRKYLILDRQLGSNNRELALAHRIGLIELNSLQSGALTEADRQLLLSAVLPTLGCARG